MYRVLATVIGVIASFVIAGLAPQNRELFTIGFAAWLGLCVYVAGLLDGGRAYGAVLSGYTVALVAVTQIDSPQNVFLTGVNRGAAIVVGVAALALVSDIFGAPSLHSSLSAKLAATHQRVRAFALAILDGERGEPIRSANLMREITALRPDIEALGAESSDGLARRAAARSAVVVLVSEVRDELTCVLPLFFALLTPTIALTDPLVQVDDVRVVDLDSGASKSDICVITLRVVPGRREALWWIGAAARCWRSNLRKSYTCSVRGKPRRATPVSTTPVRKHNHSSDDTLIQYRGKYSRHSRGQALTNFASDRHTGATCLKPSRSTVEALVPAPSSLVSLS